MPFIPVVGFYQSYLCVLFLLVFQAKGSSWGENPQANQWNSGAKPKTPSSSSWGTTTIDSWNKVGLQVVSDSLEPSCFLGLGKKSCFL
jgi:hypothetical protein